MLHKAMPILNGNYLY